MKPLLLRLVPFLVNGLLIIIFPLQINAQEPRTYPVDSLSYYQRELRSLTVKTLDSLRNSERYKFLQERIRKLHNTGKNYSGFVFFTDLMHSDFSKFNNSIAQKGFPAMDPISLRFGFGMSSKTERLMFDFYFGIGSLNSKSKKGDTAIKAGLTNLFQVDLGYDLLNSDVVSIYPYGGLSFRVSSLEYSSPVQVNPNFTNITDIIINDRSTYGDSQKLGYQAGIGFDFIVTKDKTRTTHQANGSMATIILFTKIGTNRAIGSDKYKLQGIKYKPGIKQGDWLVSVGIKFGTRH